MFNEEIQTNYIFNAHKPSTKNYKKGMEIMGTTIAVSYTHLGEEYIVVKQSDILAVIK